MPTITICPPGAARNAQFDEYVHARRSLPVEAHAVAGGEFESNGIDYSDYGRMSTRLHKLDVARRVKPSWPFNDSMLRTVLVRYVEVRAGLLKSQTGTLVERLRRAELHLKHAAIGKEAILTNLAKEYAELKRGGADAKLLQQLAVQIENLDTVLLFSNGIAGKVLRAVHLYYRQGFNSAEVAAELCIKPPHVRALLWRLRNIADKLGFGHAPRRCGTPRRRTRPEAQPAQLTPPAAKRLAIVSSPEFRELFKKSRLRMKDPNRTHCAHGHLICAANAHVGDMKRTGRYSCNPCWLLQARRYVASR